MRRVLRRYLFKAVNLIKAYKISHFVEDQDQIIQHTNPTTVSCMSETNCPSPYQSLKEVHLNHVIISAINKPRKLIRDDSALGSKQ
jgi:hypothetical protein